MIKRRLMAVMDPIQNIKPHKDSTLAMLLEAQARGWDLYCGGLNDIWLRDGVATCRATSVEVHEDQEHWYDLGDVQECPLGNMDAILMRKDPPFNMEYIFATYVLERAQQAGSLVVNDPRGLRDANEKAFVAWFPECAPPTLLTSSMDEMNSFIDDHEKVVVKPLDLMGGRSVFVTGLDDGNRNVILENVSHEGHRTVMVQKYIPDIAETGDRRIILIDGEPIPLALARIPTAGDHRGNMDAGARTELKPLTQREQWICDQIAPILREKGLWFTGIDMIGEFMTELNVTSPTGIRELERSGEVQVASPLFDFIEANVGIEPMAQARAI